MKRRTHRTKEEILRGLPPLSADRYKGKREAGGVPLAEQITKVQIINSLLKHYGILTEVAEELHCSPANICIRIKNDEELQQWRVAAEERAKDKVETKILKLAIINEDPGMLKFYAKTKMKDRGYIEEDQRGTNDRPLVIEITPATGTLPLQSAKEVEFTEVRE